MVSAVPPLQEYPHPHHEERMSSGHTHASSTAGRDLDAQGPQVCIFLGKLRELYPHTPSV